MEWLNYITEPAIKRAKKSLFNIKEQQDLMREEIKLNARILKILQNAPYQQALLHLKDGELKKCKDKIIETVAKDPLNLRARMLYVRLLGYFGQDKRAFEECFDLLEWFGLSDQLAAFLPPELIDAYHKYICNESASFIDFVHEEHSQYIEEIICSQNTILTKWRRRYFSWISIERLFKSKCTIMVFSKDGRIIFQDTDRDIKHLTNKLAVISNSESLYDVYRTDTEEFLSPQLTHDQYEALFSPCKQYEMFLNSLHFIDDEVSLNKWPSNQTSKKHIAFNIEINTVSWDRSSDTGMAYPHIEYGGRLEVSAK